LPSGIREEGVMRRIMRQWWRIALAAAVSIAVLTEPRAQPAPGDDATVLAADAALSNAMRAGDKSSARRLLSLQFSFVDERGLAHERKEFLSDLKGLADASGDDATVKVYGRIATVTGRRKSASDSEVFFLDIWAKQKGAWRAWAMQDVALAAAGAPPTASSAAGTEAERADCKNPCQAVPYRVRSPTEQDIVNAFQAIEKASVAHDADEWAKHIADEFVLYRAGRPPVTKAERITTIQQQKQSDAAVVVGEVQSMRLTAYDIAAAMLATHGAPDGSRPAYRAARVWVKRNGQWQLAISVQTDSAAP
jgi:hypothetical protein